MILGKRKNTRKILYIVVNFGEKWDQDMLLRPKSPLNQRVIKSPLNDGFGRKMGPKRNLSEKGYLASQRNSLTKNIIKT